ncbi:Lipoate-protein ligase A [Rubrivivax sp. A210]|uniref:lipoyl protein ligase domain-containing protein n=1 Tax=Rubrivivax sp. A210 TaxID=2772301 RepID=UPI0019B6E653|nr:lipoate--protein ligase [Rubrivivax sp. A210]CAD5366300.1 Lipoate-protein ligase A [Rubrivivax sp. A210]
MLPAPVSADAAAALPIFGFVTMHQSPLADGMACEADWIAGVARSGRASAQLWRGRQGLVVPRSYTALPGWVHACQAGAARGWPVQVRGSGGGIVPQGPGVINLSLAWRAGSSTPQGTDAVYAALCQGLAAALARLGIASDTQAVQGSFCDGRYNLAVGGRKLVGTAQAWKRVEGVPVVLAHALILAGGDAAALSERANEFEIDAGSPRRYRGDAVTTVARAWCEAHGQAAPPADLDIRLLAMLAEQFARMLPPRTSTMHS